MSFQLNGIGFVAIATDSTLGQFLVNGKPEIWYESQVLDSAKI